MAETVEELYYQLGLDTTNLNKGFIDAQKTVNQNIRIMNRQEALIKLRAEVDIKGLGEDIELTDALKIRQKELAEIMNLQTERVQLASAAYEQMKQRHGENAEVSQLLAIQLEQERLAMANLENQSRSLANQQKIAIDVEWEMLGLIEPALKGIDSLIAAGRTIPIPHAKAAAAAAIALSAIAVGTKKATDELEEKNLAQVLKSDFQDAQVNISNSLNAVEARTVQTTERVNQAWQNSARQMQDSNEAYIQDFLRLEYILFSQTESFGDEMSKVVMQMAYMQTSAGKTATIGIGIARSISALQKQITEFARPAVESFSELKKQAEELYLPLSKAQEITGLIDLAGGDYDDVRDFVRGIQDAVIKGEIDDPEILALERYGVTIQNAKGQLLSFDQALENIHQGYLKAREAGEAETYIMMLNGEAVHDVATFMENFGAAKQKAMQIQWSTSDFASLQELSNNLKLVEVQTNEFENALRTLTVPLANLVAESDFESFKELTALIEENRDEILYWEFVVIEAFNTAKETLLEYADVAIDKLKELNEELGITDKLGSLAEGLKNFIQDIDIGGGAVNEFEDVLTDGANSETIFDKAKKDLDAYNADNEQARAETQQTEKEITAGLTYSLRRIRDFKDELAHIQIDLKFGDDAYKKSLAELDIWKEQALRNARYYEDEQTAIAELYAAKREVIERQHSEELEKIEREKQARLAEIRRSVNSNFQTDLQNKLDDINSEQKSWVKDGMDETEAEILAEKLKGKAIQDLNEEFAEKVNSIWQSSLESRLADIEREKQAWIQKGIDEVEATQLAEQQKEQLFQEEDERLAAAESAAQENLLSAEDALNNAFEQRLNLQKQITEQQEKEKANAQEGLSILKSQLEAFKAFREGGYKGLQDFYLKQLRKQGVTDKDLKMTPEQLQAFKAAQEKAQLQLLPNLPIAEQNSPAQIPNLEDSNSTISELSKKLEEARQALQKATEEREKFRNEYLQNNSTPEINVATRADSELEQVTEKFDGLGNAAENLQQKFDSVTLADSQQDITPQVSPELPEPTANIDISDITATFDILKPTVENVNNCFDELTPQIAAVTSAFGDLVYALEQFQLPQTQNAAPPSITNNVTNNVSIQEAHAWEYDHINELAERVADVITPQILSAIGGNANVY